MRVKWKPAEWASHFFTAVVVIAVLGGMGWLCAAAGSALDEETRRHDEQVRREVQACQDKGGFIVRQGRGGDDLCVSKTDGHIIQYK